jgi:hypothetical protein
MNYELITVSLYVITALAGLWICLVRPQIFIPFLVLLLPTGNFSYECGVTWTCWKLLLVVLVVTLPATYARNDDVRGRFRLPALLLPFLLAVTASTFVAYAHDQASQIVSGVIGFDGLRGPAVRPVVQLLSLLLRIFVVVAVVAFVRTENAIHQVIKAVLIASTLVSIYGLYQVAGYYMGWPIMGIQRAQQDLSGGYGIFVVAGREVFRLGSFVGEPKEAAKFLLTSLSIIVGVKVLGIKRLPAWLTSYWNLTLHAVALILTFATSSFFGLAVAAPLVGIVWLGFIRRSRVQTFLAATVVLGLAVFILIRAVGTKEAERIYDARVVERVGEIDSPEGAALRFIGDHPNTLATGIGLGNSSFYLRPYFTPDYYRPLTVSLNSSYLEILLEGGIAALLTLAIFLIGWLLRAMRLAKQLPRTEVAAILVLLVGVSLIVAANGAFSSTEGTGQIWLFWGLLITACNIAQARRNSQIPPLKAVNIRLVRRTAPRKPEMVVAGSNSSF